MGGRGVYSEDGQRIFWGLLASLHALVQAIDPVVAASISVASYTLADPVITSVLGWSVIALGFYLAAEELYGHVGSFPYRKHTFPLLFTILALTVGVVSDILITSSALTTQAKVSRLLFTMTGVFAVEIGVMSMYLLSTSSNPFGKDGQLHAIIDDVAGDRLHSVFVNELKSFGGKKGYVGKCKSLFVVAGLLAFPAWLGGNIGLMLTFIQPIPDLVVILWAVIGSVYVRTSRRRSEQTAQSEDPVKWILDYTQPMMSSVVGAEFVATIGIGLALSIGILYNSLELLLSGTLVTSPPERTAVAHWIVRWDWIGMVALLGTAGAYSFLAWIRELERLPGYLSTFEEEENAILTKKPRIPGVVLPTCFGLWIATYSYRFFILDVQSGDYTLQIEQLGYSYFEYHWLSFALIWPLYIFCMVLLGILWLRRDQQSVRWEGAVIVGSVILQLFAFGSMVRLGGNQWPSTLIVFIILLLHVPSKIKMTSDQGRFPIAESQATLAVGVIVLCFALTITSFVPIKLLLVLLGGGNIYRGLKEEGYLGNITTN